ncbi:uncharacterized protein [Miscanthus floridulus]|uniref:uncharacterized protein isoform X2 n=1 Tax=Miscanthus floridulus TaxID=154761 RepID=UPI00345AA5F9
MLGNQQQQLRRARTGGSLTPVDEEHNRDQHRKSTNIWRLGQEYRVRSHRPISGTRPIRNDKPIRKHLTAIRRAFPGFQIAVATLRQGRQVQRPGT